MLPFNHILDQPAIPPFCSGYFLAVPNGQLSGRVASPTLGSVTGSGTVDSQGNMTLAGNNSRGSFNFFSRLLASRSRQVAVSGGRWSIVTPTRTLGGTFTAQTSTATSTSFAGSYRGSVSEGGQTAGTLTATIAQDNSITATAAFTSGTNVTISGQLDPSTGTGTFAASGNGVKGTFQGTFTAQGGVVSGSGTFMNDVGETGTWTLTRQ